MGSIGGAAEAGLSLCRDTSCMTENVSAAKIHIVRRASEIEQVAVPGAIANMFLKRESRRAGQVLGAGDTI